MLELIDGKLSREVLRGGGGGCGDACPLTRRWTYWTLGRYNCQSVHRIVAMRLGNADDQCLGSSNAGRL